MSWNLKLILKLHIHLHLDDQIPTEPIPDATSYFEQFSIYCCSCRRSMERRRQDLTLTCLSMENQEETVPIIAGNHPDLDQRTPIVRPRSNRPIIQANIEHNLPETENTDN